jgi:hypothetical protein
MHNKEHILGKGGSPSTGVVRLKHLYTWPHTLQYDDDEFPMGTELVVNGSPEEKDGSYHAYIELHTGYIVPQKHAGNQSECGPGICKPDNLGNKYGTGPSVPTLGGEEIEYQRDTISLGNEEVDFLIEALLMIKKHFQHKQYDAA